MTVTEIITDYTDEIIAIIIVGAYVVAWFIKPMPSEPLMLVLGFYFGRKITNGV